MLSTVRILGLAIAMLAFIGCDSAGDEDSTDRSITATVDGQPFDSNEVNATFDSGVLQITGMRGTTDQLTVSVQNAAAGTVQLGTNNSKGTLSFRQGTAIYQANFLGGSGTVTIEKVDENGAKGTFSGSAVNHTGGGGTVTISDGSFDVTF